MRSLIRLPVKAENGSLKGAENLEIREHKSNFRSRSIERNLCSIHPLIPTTKTIKLTLTVDIAKNSHVGMNIVGTLHKRSSLHNTSLIN